MYSNLHFSALIIIFILIEIKVNQLYKSILNTVKFSKNKTNLICEKKGRSVAGGQIPLGIDFSLQHDNDKN